MQSLMTVPVTLSSFSNAALCQRTPRPDGLGDGDENADLKHLRLRELCGIRVKSRGLTRPG